MGPSGDFDRLAMEMPIAAKAIILRLGGVVWIINAAYTPAHSEEGCCRLLLIEVPLLVPRPCNVQVLQQISDFEPLRMQHVRSPTFLYNSERWLVRAPEKQTLPASPQLNSALSTPKSAIVYQPDRTGKR